MNGPSAGQRTEIDGSINATNIDAFSRPVAAGDNKPVDPNSPKCVGCGRYHGSINLSQLCLQRTVVSLRRHVEELEEEVRRLGGSRGKSMDLVDDAAVQGSPS